MGRATGYDAHPKRQPTLPPPPHRGELPAAFRPPMRLLLTGARAPATLELARLAHRAGHEVHVADSVGLHLCRWSNCVAGVHRLPPPRFSYGAFVEGLARVVEAERIERVIPTCEEVFYVAHAAPRLGAPVLTDTPERLARWHDKGRFVETAAAAGLAVPETHRLLSIGDAVGLPQTGWVFKPAFSRFSTRVRFVKPGDTPPEDVRPTPSDPWVAQAWLDGPTLSTYSVAHGGRLAAHATYRADATAGPAGAAVSFVGEDHAGTEAWVDQFARATGATGQLAFDFIETPAGVAAVECNPRLTSGLHLFRGHSEVVAALLGPTPSVLRPPPGRRFLSRLALRHYGHAPRPGHDLIHDAADPWPHRLQGLVWLSVVGRALLHRIDPRAVTTRDIEWNGEPLPDLAAAPAR